MTKPASRNSSWLWDTFECGLVLKYCPQRSPWGHGEAGGREEGRQEGGKKGVKKPELLLALGGPWGGERQGGPRGSGRVHVGSWLCGGCWLKLPTAADAPTSGREEEVGLGLHVERDGRTLKAPLFSFPP